jgi:iron-sulfur cluster repair protein YtfE (RIC family)
MSTKELAQITPEATINEITSVNKQAAELLKSIGLSLSEHENETLQSICQQRQWSEDEVLQWVKKHSSPANGEQATSHSAQAPDEQSSLKKWSKYLEERFIDPNHELLEELTNSFPRIHKVHGIQYSWLKNMEWHFNKFREALTMYYQFERKKFLPLAERLHKSKRTNINHGTIRKLQKSFRIIKKDQDRLQRLMQTICNKGNQFENPEGACSTLRIQNKNFKILFAKLDQQFRVESEQIIPRIDEEIQAKK